MPVFFVGGVIGAYIAFFTFGSLFSGAGWFLCWWLEFYHSLPHFLFYLSTQKLLKLGEIKMSITIEGNDNYGHPRQEFADRIAEQSDAEFVTEAQDRIWLSAYANNNPRSDYHWQADACYKEAARRGKPELYTEAYKLAVSSAA